MQAIYTPVSTRCGANSGKGASNRVQALDCAHLMGQIVPVVVEIMMTHPQAVWAEACYPVVSL